MTVELSANTEERRPGEVALGVLDDSPGSGPAGFAWVPFREARAFAMEILAKSRDAEDLLRE